MSKPSGLPSIPKVSSRPVKKGGLFDDDDDDDFLAKKNKPKQTPTNAENTAKPLKAKKGLFDDDDDDDGFLKKATPKPKIAANLLVQPDSKPLPPPSSMGKKKGLFDDDGDDDADLFSRKSYVPKDVSTKPSSTTQAKKNMFVETDEEIPKPSKLPVKKKGGLFDDSGSGSEDSEAERKKRMAKKKIMGFK